MQSGKDKRLSGTIAGGAETFFGKAKASTMDKMLSKLTTIVAIVFCVLVLASYLIQDTTDFSSLMGSGSVDAGTTETIPVEDVVGEVDLDGEAAAEETEAAAE